MNNNSSNINKLTYVTKTFYTPKNYPEPTKSTSGHMVTTSGTTVNNNSNSALIWNSSKVLLNKDTKDKAYLFKSQKYIKDFKGTTVLTANNDSGLMVKKEERK